MEANANGKQLAEIPRDKRIALCFKAQDGTAKYFKVNPDVKLQKLLMFYCKEANMGHKDVRFIYDGKRVAVDETPAQIGMEDGDEIDVMIHQIGGGEVMSQN